MKKLTKKQMDYAESLIEENKKLILRYTPGDLPRHWSINRIYKTIGYKTNKTLEHVPKESTIDRLLQTIKSAKKAEEGVEQKRRQFKGIANECIDMGATAEEVKEYCSQNVHDVWLKNLRARIQATYESESDAYKTVLENRERAQAEVVSAKYSKQYRLSPEPDWWIATIREYWTTLLKESDPENATEMD